MNTREKTMGRRFIGCAKGLLERAVEATKLSELKSKSEVYINRT